MDAERTSTLATDSVDARLLTTLVGEKPELVVTELRAYLDDPETDRGIAEQLLPYLDHLQSSFLVREVVERGVDAVDPEVRRLFADYIGTLAKRDRNDAYTVLHHVALQAASADPENDLVLVGLRAVRRDVPPEAFDFITTKGLEILKVENKPGARERKAQVNQRFQAALKQLDQ